MEEKTQRGAPTLVWVDAFKVGDLVAHPKYGDVRYTEPQLLEAIRNFRDLSAKGYATTVLREHGTEDSYVYGSVHDVRISTDGFFQCAVEFYRLEDRNAYNAGILREFSPGFAHTWLDPHTAEKLENVLLELSFTSRAYQRNLRPPQGINPGVVLSNNSAPTSLADTPSGVAALQKEPAMEEEEMPPEATEEEEKEVTLADFMNSFNEFAAEVRGYMAPPMEEEEPATMSDDVTEVQKLSDEVARLNSELLTAKLSARGVDAERIPTLVALSRTATPEQFAEVVNYAATPKAGAATIQPEIGAIGTSDTGGEPTVADIIAEAAADGVKYGAGKFTLWVSKNHPDRLEEITTFAKQ